MKLSHARRSERRGFTLVELMIVIAIISVLISLISAAVWKALVAANRAKVRSEIAQFAVAVENFKAQYKFYPPSRLHLAAKLSAYNLGYNASGQPNNPLDADSVQILLQMFPGIKDTWSGAGINWAGTNPPDMSVNTILEGDQCLVFFLGGIPDNFSTSPNCTGFSTNAFNPAAHIPLGGHTSPSFFEFDSSRL